MIDIYDDEVSYIKETHEKILLVYWSLGNTCTYACSYCPAKFHDGSNPYQSLEVVQRTLEMLPRAHVIFTGGEATYHPDFERIVIEAPEHLRISVISNASRPIAFWERIVDRLDLVMLTFHAEFADLERFFRTAELVFLKSKRKGAINLTMIPAHWDKCVAAHRRFTEAGMLVTVKPLLQNFATPEAELISDYSEDQSEWIKSNTNKITSKNIAVYNKKDELLWKTTPAEMIINKQTNFSGWQCHTPTQYLSIHSDGEVFNTACKQRERVGSIYTDIKFDSEPIVCEQTFCWCFTDIQTKKVKNV
jgi:organic radical activating enzyme